MASLPQSGQKAPQFKELTALKGKTVVLFFYPKDDTPGCTVEACGFRDRFKDIESLGAVILGISPDSTKSHDKFITKYNLPYALVADADKKIVQDHGVWAQTSMSGKKYMGVARTTFIVGKDGTIVKVFEKVKPEGHSQEIIDALKAL